MSRLALVAALAAIVVACSSTPPASPTPAAAGDAVERLTAQPFGQQQIDAATEALAQTGVATYAQPDSAAPIMPVAEPAAPMKLFGDQVRAMALEANVGGGIEGSELDALVETEPDLAPTSFVLAGYIAAAETDGSRAAARLMGVEDWDAEDWRDAPSVVFPQIVLVMFTADVTRERMSEAGAPPAVALRAGSGAAGLDPAPIAVPAAPIAQAGACSTVVNFINNSLRAVFNALRLGEPSRGVGRVFVKIWNFVVSVLETVVTTIVREFKQQVFDKIAQVAAIVGTVATIVSAVRPWTVSVKTQPGTTEKGIAGVRDPDHGQITARVELGGLDQWPSWAVDCARAANRPLPNLKPEGAPVTWLPISQSPAGLVGEDTSTSALDANAAATLDFTTLIDSVDDPWETRPGRIVTRVDLQRPGLRDLLDWIESQIWSGIPSVAVGPLLTYLGPSLERAKNSLARLISVSSSGPATVLYHVQQEENACQGPGSPLMASVQHLPGVGSSAVAQGEGGCGASNGDPHIVTIDGDSYDFMAAGEFVLLRNRDNSFELQARQEPFAGSNHLSVNTALAMRAGEHRIGITTDPASDNLSVTVDGAVVSLDQPVEVGGARITSDGYTSEIRFADGTTLYAVGQQAYGVSLTLATSPTVTATGIGVMGPIPSGGLDVPALPDGTVLPEAFGRDEYNDSLYRTFADAWRVTAATSLFDYAPGTSTETYTLRDFPVLDEVITLDDLTPEQLAAGEAACRNIQFALLRQQCIYDVAVTGDPGFGDIYDLTQEVVSGDVVATTGQRARLVSFYSDDDGPTPLEVYAWTEEGPALVATVPFGESSEWFDPGTLIEFERPTTKLSIQRQGEPVNEYGLNLVDRTWDTLPGLERTILIGTDEPDQFHWVGGRAATSTLYDEVSPDGFGMAEAPADGALLFLSVEGLVHTHSGVTFFTSAGKGCLNQPGFDGLAQLSGVTGESGGRYYEGPLSVAPTSDMAITLHPGSQSDDAFSARCDSDPIHGPIPFSIGAGERTHLLLYSLPDEDQIRSLVLPFGE